MSQRERLQAALAAPMVLEAAMERAGVEGMLKGKRCGCLGQGGAEPAACSWNAPIWVQAGDFRC